ncbi:MAG: hypothetical protein AAGH71_06645 [Planctomycetota bacterium]
MHRTARTIAAATAALIASQASATPENFDLIDLSFAAGAGGIAEGLPLGPDIGFGFLFDEGSGSVSAQESNTFGSAMITLDYAARVEQTPDSLGLVIDLDSETTLSFDPAASTGLIQATGSLDFIELIFTLDRPHFITGSGFGFDVFGLGGTPDAGPAGSHPIELGSGSYRISLSSGIAVADYSATPGIGEGTFIDSRTLRIDLNAVPAPSGAGLLALAGLAVARRRR